MLDYVPFVSDLGDERKKTKAYSSALVYIMFEAHACAKDAV